MKLSLISLTVFLFSFTQINCFVSQPNSGNVDVVVSSVTTDKLDYGFNETIRANTVIKNVGTDVATVTLQNNMLNTMTNQVETSTSPTTSIELKAGESKTIPTEYIMTVNQAVATACFWRSIAKVNGDLNPNNNQLDSANFYIR